MAGLPGENADSEHDANAHVRAILRGVGETYFNNDMEMPPAHRARLTLGNVLRAGVVAVIAVAVAAGPNGAGGNGTAGTGKGKEG